MVNDNDLIRDRRGEARDQGRRPCENRQRLDLCSHKPKKIWKDQKLEEAKKYSSLQPSEEVWSSQYHDIGLLSSRTIREKISGFLNNKCCGSLLQQSQKTNILTKLPDSIHIANKVFSSSKSNPIPFHSIFYIFLVISIIFYYIQYIFTNLPYFTSQNVCALRKVIILYTYLCSHSTYHGASYMM